MSYQEDLILSIYGRGEPGLAMGKEIPPGKGGSPGQPYDPPKPTGPYVPAPSRNLANLADGTPDASIMNYVTEQGFFLDGQGGAYMQTGGKLYDAGEYNPDIHGLPVPLVQQMQINPDVANITPKDFSPPPFRYMPHIRIPAIKEAEMKHMKNFIEAMGGSTKGLSKKNKTNDMLIAGNVGFPHSNVQIDTGEDITTGETYKRVLPNYGAGRIKFPVRPKKL